MTIKLTVAAVILVCAACGTYRQGADTAHPTTQPNSAINAIHQVPVDAVLIDESCYAYDACRTTAHGLGV